MKTPEEFLKGNGFVVAADIDREARKYKRRRDSK